MSDTTFIFFHIGFYWLYFFIFHRPIWINNRIRDIENTFIIYIVESIFILTVVIMSQMLELITQLFSPILTNLIYTFLAAIFHFLERVIKKVVYLFIVVAEIVIDFLIIKFDYIVFYLLKKIYLEIIKPEFLNPTLKWIEPKKSWVCNKFFFIKHQQEFYRRLWRQ